jgi:hypothetical protein
MSESVQAIKVPRSVDGHKEIGLVLSKRSAEVSKAAEKKEKPPPYAA